MKISITVSDDEGRVFQGDAVLVAVAPDHPAADVHSSPGNWASDFQLPMRAFMKKHAAGKNGAQKFALLLAHIAKGDTHACVPAANIESEWNKMTAIMGGAYNRAHSTRAKERGWVDSPKWGTFTLLRGWEAIAIDETVAK